MVSTYEKLGQVDATLRDRVMQQLGVTRKMLDNNMSIEEYLRVTGQQEQLQAGAVHRSRALASSPKRQTPRNPADMVWQVKDEPVWVHKDTVNHQYTGPVIYNMADPLNSSKEKKWYDYAATAADVLNKVITGNQIIRQIKKWRDAAHEGASQSDELAAEAAKQAGVTATSKEAQDLAKQAAAPGQDAASAASHSHDVAGQGVNHGADAVSAASHTGDAASAVGHSGDAISAAGHSHDVISQSIGHTGEVAEAAMGAKSAAAAAAGHGAEEVATQAGSTLLGSMLGPLTIGFGLGVDQHFVVKAQREINEAYQTHCKAELKIVADYWQRNRNPDGSASTASSLTDVEKQAFENLWETMEFNGGSKLFGRKIIRNLGTAAGALGGPGGGLAVFGMVKAMESGEGVPKPEAIQDTWIAANVIGAPTTTLLGVIFPPSLFFTVPAMVAANVAAGKVLYDVNQWHATYKSDDGRKGFLFELGEFAHQQVNKSPTTFTDEQLRFQLQGNAEAAAKAVARGPEHHTTEDIRTLGRYARIAPILIGQITQNNPDMQSLHNRYEAMMKFLADTKFAEHKDSLIAGARKRGQGR